MKLCGVLLTEIEQRVLHLCTLDYSYEEIAERIALSPASVRSILLRLRKKAGCQTNAFLLYSYGLMIGIDARENKHIE